MRRLLPLLVLLLPACTPAGGPPAPATTVTTTTLATTAPPRPVEELPTTTTTRPPPPPVTVAHDRLPEEMAPVLEAFYLWVKDPATDPPEGLPEGLVEHLADLEPTPEPLVVEGEVTSSVVLGTTLAVARSGRDVVLLVDEGEGWRIVGARMGRFEKPAWYGAPPDRPRMVLVIGSDARPGQVPERLRADGLQILSAVPGERAGAIVGIPRDSWVVIPGGGRSKITDVMPRHGPEGVLESARHLTGLPLEGYVVTGFHGFTKLVDALGGLSVLVPVPMTDPASRAYFEPGRQDFDGRDALAYARNRRFPDGDFTRSRHQGQLIRAALREVQGMGIRILPHLLGILTEFATTDLSPEELLLIGATAWELEFERVPNTVVPGSTGWVGRRSVVFLGGGAERVFAQLREDGLLD